MSQSSNVDTKDLNSSLQDLNLNSSSNSKPLPSRPLSSEDMIIGIQVHLDHLEKKIDALQSKLDAFVSTFIPCMDHIHTMVQHIEDSVSLDE